MVPVNCYGFRMWRCVEARVVAPVILCFFLAACHKPATPQAQIRTTITQAEEAVAQKDIAALKAMVSDKFNDPEGHDKKAVESIVRYYFMRNESIHLFTRVRKIDVADDTHLQTSVYAAMTSEPIKSAQELEGLRADLYHFEFFFAKESGHWRVIKAEWRPAELIDFL